MGEDTEMWSWSEDKAFEIALVTIPEHDEHRLEKIAAHVPGKSMEEIIEHYLTLLDDVALIESGHVELPNYSDASVQRSKGMPWTEQEHRFLLFNFLLFNK